MPGEQIRKAPNNAAIILFMMCLAFIIHFSINSVRYFVNVTIALFSKFLVEKRATRFGPRRYVLLTDHPEIAGRRTKGLKSIAAMRLERPLQKFFSACRYCRYISFFGLCHMSLADC